MKIVADVTTHSGLERRLTANIQLTGYSLINNSCWKLIQGATTTRKQPGSPPKRTQPEALSVPLNMHRSHFAKAKPSNPRFQSTVSPAKSVPKEMASYVSKVTVRYFTETRIIRQFRSTIVS